MEEQLRILESAQSQSLTDFTGASLMADDRQGAMESLNVVFAEKTVQTRPGFTPFFTPGPSASLLTAGPRRINTLIPWDAQSSANRLLYLWMDPPTGGPKVVSRTLDGLAADDEWELATMPADTSAITAAFLGGRVFFAGVGGGPYGTSGGYVWDGNIVSGFPSVDPLFQRPFLTSELSLGVVATAVAPGEYPLTAGDHAIAVVVTTRNGHATGVSPTDTTFVVVPLIFTADGVSAYTLTATPASTWPTWAYSIQAVMSPITNLEKLYYVPQGLYQVLIAFGTSSPATMHIAITDSELQGTGTATAREVEDLSQQLRISIANQPPIYPALIREGPDGRMAYLSLVSNDLLDIQSAVFISDPNHPQTMTYDRNMIQLKGFRKISSMVWFGNTLVMFGPNSTTLRLATGDFPVEWPAEEGIDGGIGTPFIYGVTSDSSRGYLLVAHKSGLHKFAGNAYDRIPLSQRQGRHDWDAINWAAPTAALEIHEIVDLCLIVVKAPIIEPGLALPTVATHLLVWDYSDGMDPYRIRYSAFKIGAPNGAGINGGPDMGIGGIAFGLDSSSARKSLWIARGDAASVVSRWLDANLDNDPAILGEDDVSANHNFYLDGVNTDGTGIPFLSSYTTKKFLSPVGLADWIATKFCLRGGPITTVDGSPIGKTWLYAVAWAGSFANGPSARPTVVALRSFINTAQTSLKDSWPFRLINLPKSETFSLKVSNGRVAKAWWKMTTEVKVWFNPWGRGGS